MNVTERPPRLLTIFQKHDSPLYFVTFNAYERRKLFANKAVHQSFRDFAERGLREKGIAVGRYVLMPDHVHLFVRGTENFRLAQWVRLLKQMLGKKLRELGNEPEYWQRGFFDHLIRRDESDAQKWAYVKENPVRAGLVSRSEDWPYQGEIVVIVRA